MSFKFNNANGIDSRLNTIAFLIFNENQKFILSDIANFIWVTCP